MHGIHGRVGRNRPDPYMLVIEVHNFIEPHVVTDDILRSSPLYRIRNPFPWKKYSLLLPLVCLPI